MGSSADVSKLFQSAKAEGINLIRFFPFGISSDIQLQTSPGALVYVSKSYLYLQPIMIIMMMQRVWTELQWPARRYHQACKMVNLFLVGLMSQLWLQSDSKVVQYNVPVSFVTVESYSW